LKKSFKIKSQVAK